MKKQVLLLLFVLGISSINAFPAPKPLCDFVLGSDPRGVLKSLILTETGRPLEWFVPPDQPARWFDPFSIQRLEEIARSTPPILRDTYLDRHQLALEAAKLTDPEIRAILGYLNAPELVRYPLELSSALSSLNSGQSRGAVQPSWSLLAALNVVLPTVDRIHHTHHTIDLGLNVLRNLQRSHARGAYRYYNQVAIALAIAVRDATQSHIHPRAIAEFFDGMTHSAAANMILEHFGYAQSLQFLLDQAAGAAPENRPDPDQVLSVLFRRVYVLESAPYLKGPLQNQPLDPNILHIYFAVDIGRRYFNRIGDPPRHQIMNHLLHRYEARKEARLKLGRG